MGSLYHLRGLSSSAAPSQNFLIELKQLILKALAKLNDRDTQHNGVLELERIALEMPYEGIPIFLACLYDTDDNQKTSARKECIKMFGVLSAFHGELIIPHLSKIVAAVVRRFKDTDSGISQACADAMGTLIRNLSVAGGKVGVYDRQMISGFFFRPLLDALGEQNKNAQVAAVLCLDKVMQNTTEPLEGSISRLLPRFYKALSKPGFFAKGPLINAIGTLIEVTGPVMVDYLPTLMPVLQEALSNSDWITRKSATETLGNMISRLGAAPLMDYKISTLAALEGCRSDKVKPVRESALKSFPLWQDVPGPTVSKRQLQSPNRTIAGPAGDRSPATMPSASPRHSGRLSPSASLTSERSAPSTFITGSFFSRSKTSNYTSSFEAANSPPVKPAYLSPPLPRAPELPPASVTRGKVDIDDFPSTSQDEENPPSRNDARTLDSVQLKRQSLAQLMKENRRRFKQAQVATDSGPSWQVEIAVAGEKEPTLMVLKDEEMEDMEEEDSLRITRVQPGVGDRLESEGIEPKENTSFLAIQEANSSQTSSGIKLVTDVPNLVGDMENLVKPARPGRLNIETENESSVLSISAESDMFLNMGHKTVRVNEKGKRVLEFPTTSSGMVVINTDVETEVETRWMASMEHTVEKDGSSSGGRALGSSTEDNQGTERRSEGEQSLLENASKNLLEHHKKGEEYFFERDWPNPERQGMTGKRRDDQKSLEVVAVSSVGVSPEKDNNLSVRSSDLHESTSHVSRGQSGASPHDPQSRSFVIERQVQSLLRGGSDDSLVLRTSDGGERIPGGQIHIVEQGEAHGSDLRLSSESEGRRSGRTQSINGGSVHSRTSAGMAESGPPSVTVNGSQESLGGISGPGAEDDLEVQPTAGSEEHMEGGRLEWSFDEAAVLRSIENLRQLAAGVRRAGARHEGDWAGAEPLRDSRYDALSEGSEGEEQDSGRGQDETKGFSEQLLRMEQQQARLLSMMQAFMGATQSTLKRVETRMHSLEQVVQGMAIEQARWRAHAHTVESTPSAGQTNQPSSRNSEDIASTAEADESTRQVSQVHERHAGGSETAQVDSFGKLEDAVPVDSKSAWEESQRLQMNDTAADGEAGNEETITWEESGNLRQISGFFSGETSRDKFVYNSGSEQSGTTYAIERNMNPASWSWSSAAELLRVGNVDEAYMKGVKTGDTSILVRLMGRTGPKLGELRQETAVEVLRFLLGLLERNEYMDYVLPWIRQLVEMAVGENGVYLEFPSDMKWQTIAGLQAHSQVLKVGWTGPMAKQLADQLSGVWLS